MEDRRNSQSATFSSNTFQHKIHTWYLIALWRDKCLIIDCCYTWTGRLVRGARKYELLLPRQQRIDREQTKVSGDERQQQINCTGEVGLAGSKVRLRIHEKQSLDNAKLLMGKDKISEKEFVSNYCPPSLSACLTIVHFCSRWSWPTGFLATTMATVLSTWLYHHWASPASRP